MSMALKLAGRAQAEKPIRVGLIGAGKFGTMFLSQALRTPGLHVVSGLRIRPRPRSTRVRDDWRGAGSRGGKVDRRYPRWRPNVPYGRRSSRRTASR